MAGLFKIIRNLIIGQGPSSDAPQAQATEGKVKKNKMKPSSKRIDEKTTKEIDEKINTVFSNDLAEVRQTENGEESYFQAGDLELTLSGEEGRVIFQDEVVATFSKENDGFVFHPERNVNEDVLYKQINESFHKKREFEDVHTGRTKIIEAKEKALRQLEMKKHGRMDGYEMTHGYENDRTK